MKKYVKFGYMNMRSYQDFYNDLMACEDLKILKTLKKEWISYWVEKTTKNLEKCGTTWEYRGEILLSANFQDRILDVHLRIQSLEKE